MKPIKFKGYNKKNNKWLYGSYIHNVKGDFIAPDGIFSEEFTWKDFLVEPNSVKQLLITLSDGAEIYEDEYVTVEGFDDVFTATFAAVGTAPAQVVSLSGNNIKNHIKKSHN